MENLKPPAGAKMRRKIVGRGPGSGMGKTSCKGHKGQNSRKGGGVRRGFEGGQTPLIRRIPKRGFKNDRFTEEFNEINIWMLNKFADNSIVDRESLNKLSLIKDNKLKIKILGVGELEKKIKEIHADKISASAKEKIEKSGCKVVVKE